MTDENRRLAVIEQLAHSDSAYREAALLRTGSLFKGATSRLYYALYHLLVALLLTQGIEPRRHRSLPHLLSTHFSALLSASEIAFVAQLSANRDLADYAPAWSPTPEMVIDQLANADALIAKVRAWLIAGGWTGG